MADKEISPAVWITECVAEIESASSVLSNVRSMGEAVLEAIESAVSKEGKAVSFEERRMSIVNPCESVRAQISSLKRIVANLSAKGVFHSSDQSAAANQPVGIKHMGPLICSDNFGISYAWRRQILAQSAVLAVEHSRRVSDSFSQQKEISFPEISANRKRKSTQPVALETDKKAVIQTLTQTPDPPPAVPESGILASIKEASRKFPDLTFQSFSRTEWLGIQRQNKFRSNRFPASENAKKVVSTIVVSSPDVLKAIFVVSHPGASWHIDCISLFSAVESPCPWGDSKFDSFQVITREASRKLYELNKGQTTPSRRFLEMALWLQNLVRAFNWRCGKCRSMVGIRAESMKAMPMFLCVRKGIEMLSSLKSEELICNDCC